MATSSPRHDLVKNLRVHPTHWLIDTQVATTAWVAHLPEPLDATVPGAFAAERSFPVVLVGGDVRRLVGALSADRVLCRRVDMIIPFNHRAGTVAEVAAEVASALSSRSFGDGAASSASSAGGAVARIFCLPRQDEGAVIAAATSRGVALSPTQFATTASILRLDEQWLFSTLDRAEWDPTAWRIERMGTKALAYHPWASEAVARLVGDVRSATAVGGNSKAIAEAFLAAGVPRRDPPEVVVAAGPREETLEALETSPRRHK